MITYFSKQDLISFGNHLLSIERKNRVSELTASEVNHADFENWLSEESKRMELIDHAANILLQEKLGEEITNAINQRE